MHTNNEFRGCCLGECWWDRERITESRGCKRIWAWNSLPPSARRILTQNSFFFFTRVSSSRQDHPISRPPTTTLTRLPTPPRLRRIVRVSQSESFEDVGGVPTAANTITLSVVRISIHRAGENEGIVEEGRIKEHLETNTQRDGSAKGRGEGDQGTQLDECTIPSWASVDPSRALEDVFSWSASGFRSNEWRKISFEGLMTYETHWVRYTLLKSGYL